MKLMESEAVAFIRERLRGEGQSMTRIAAATGISKRWLEMMRAGEIPNPGINSLTTIAAYYGARIVTVRMSKKETESPAAVRAD